MLICLRFYFYSFFFFFLLLICFSCNNDRKNEKKQLDKTSILAGQNWKEKRNKLLQSEENSSSDIIVEQYLQQIIDSAAYSFAGNFGSKINKQAFEIYQNRNYKPIWKIYDKSSTLPGQYLNILDSIHFEGLDANDYDFNMLSQYRSIALDKVGKKKRMSKTEALNSAKGDLYFTISFLQLLSHIKKGKVSESYKDLKWVFYEKVDINYELLVEKAIFKDDIKIPIAEISPKINQYHQLKDLLKLYYSLLEDDRLKSLRSGITLSSGETSEDVLILRQNLYLVNDLKSFNPKSSVNSLFDNKLKQAVISFQRRHGLDTTGIVDDDFIEKMNTPIEDLIKLVNINLERIRWLPDSLGEKHIIVNIPEFNLTMVEKDKQASEMKVITGEVMRSTPVFSDKVEYVAFSPYWNVPRSIAVNEHLPQIKENLDFLKRNHLEVVENWDPDAAIINPKKIEWDNINKDNFPYRLRQKPGPWNALGKVKFMFPNNYNIYLHDTPEKELFEQEQRDLSHGCIRVEHPVELTSFLLPELSYEEITSKMNKSKEESISLKKRVPVHIVYNTVYINNRGEAIFIKDIYDFDKKLIAIFTKKKKINK